MAIDDIKKELENKFGQPLPEFYKRRIIFWNDEDAEFQEEVNDLVLDNAKVLMLNNTNHFISKKLLSEDDLFTNYLVYNPLHANQENDWFLDIKLYSEEYRADLLSRWMQDMNILNTHDMRLDVKVFKGFFNAAARRNQIKGFNTLIDRKSKLYMAILSAICKLKSIDADEILKAAVKAGPDIENQIKLDLLSYGASSHFWKLANQLTGFNLDENIDHFAEHIVLSALSRTLPSSVLAGLDNKYSDFHNGHCYDLLFNWIHSNEKDSAKNIIEHVEKSLSLRSRFNNFEIKDLIDTDIVPCIDEVILSKLMTDVLNRSIDAATLQSIIEKRRTSAWFDKYSHFYNGLYQVSLMKKFYEKNMNSFHHTIAKDMWKAYTQEYYQMDVIYREFHNNFAVCLQKINYVLDDEFKRIADYVENEYKNWYLLKLNENWTRVIEGDLASTGEITGLSQQKNFYYDEVRSIDNKVFVIVSDALRYDVAATLMDQLRIETKCDVEMKTKQSIFPSITKFGMAALLPHKTMTVSNNGNDLKVLIDGHTTEMGDREYILKQRNENSVALKYKDIISMKREERRNIIKGKDVIYIYHDTIDASSHNDESKVFNACNEAISEIKTLVNLICGELNGLNILITSDHGFLYTYQPLNEDDKMSRSSFRSNVIEQGRRYVLTDENANPEFLIPVKGFYNDSNVLGFAPRENIRIKGPGGLNFVHGGTALQEMVVPVIKYKYLRSGYKSYERNKDKYDAKPVSVALLSSNRKISNMIFNLSFYQKEPVAANYVACNYEVYITDESGAIVSDRQKIIADKTSDIAKDREFKLTFNLKSRKYDSREIYYLVIVDESNIQLPIKEEMQIDIAMAIDDFNFFE